MKFQNLALLAIVSISSNVHAALIGRLPVTEGGTDYQAYYDTEANLTWLADANYAMSSGYDADGLIYQFQANTLAKNLIIDGISGWRLPEKMALTANCDTQIVHYYNCSDSEMGNLFYNVLGGVAGNSIHDVHNSNYHLFSNIQNNYYWSSDEIQVTTSYYAYWLLNFSSGRQALDGVDNGPYNAWAVRTGDVIPIPPAVWLFGSGLIGLAGLARRKV